MKKAWSLLIAAAVAVTCYSQTSRTELYDYALKRVADRIYVTQRPEPLRETVDGNVVIIINDEGVVVVDASVTPLGARNIIADIKKLSDKPVTHFINTHFHGDHTFGNQEFKKEFPEMVIISTTETKRVMDARIKTFKSVYSNDSIFRAKQKDMDDQIAFVKANKLPASEKIIANLERHRDYDIYRLREIYKGIVITPPTVTFEKEMVLKPGNREIRIMFLGKGDTPGDAWVFLPKEKILITGDALPHPIPFGFSATPSEWIQSLEQALELDFETMIPGHGDVQYNKEYMHTVCDLLKAVKKQVVQAIKKGMTLDETRKVVNMDPWEKQIVKGDGFIQFYFNEYFKEPVVSRFYKELKVTD